MSERIIVIVETVAIVVLAITVVIYGQVLLQQFLTQPDAPTVVEEAGDTEAPERDLDTAARLEVLESLSGGPESGIPNEERAAALESLSPAEVVAETEVSPDAEAAMIKERMKVLESLRSN